MPLILTNEIMTKKFCITKTFHKCKIVKIINTPQLMLTNYCHFYEDEED